MRYATGTVRKKGYSLTEMLIYFVFMLMIMSVIYGVFTYTTRYHRSLRVYSGLQQRALITLARIQAEISETDAQYIKIIDVYPNNGNPVKIKALIFPSLKSVPNEQNEYNPEYKIDETTGELMWQKWVCYCPVHATGEKFNLERKEKAIPGGTLISEELDTNNINLNYFTNADRTEVMLALPDQGNEQRLTRFEMSTPTRTSQQVFDSYNLFLELESTYNPGLFKVSAETEVVPRNSR
jgi:Tfp pilus assembly protein PilV